MKLFVLCGLLLAVACSPTKITTSPTILPPVNAPIAAPLQLSNIQWRVLTEMDMKTILLNLQKTKNGHVVFYSLDDKNYTALDTNLLDIKRYIEEQNQTILFYRQLENNKLDIIPEKKVK